MKIARNRTRLIDRIFDRATECRRFDLDNQFAGLPTELQYAQTSLAASRRAYLYYKADRASYTVHVHGNLWYEFSSLSPAEALCSLAPVERDGPLALPPAIPCFRCSAPLGEERATICDEGPTTALCPSCSTELLDHLLGVCRLDPKFECALEGWLGDVQAARIIG